MAEKDRTEAIGCWLVLVAVVAYIIVYIDESPLFRRLHDSQIWRCAAWISTAIGVLVGVMVIGAHVWFYGGIWWRSRK